jgi:hypothetical protein
MNTRFPKTWQHEQDDNLGPPPELLDDVCWEPPNHASTPLRSYERPLYPGDLKPAAPPDTEDGGLAPPGPAKGGDARETDRGRVGIPFEAFRQQWQEQIMADPMLEATHKLIGIAISLHINRDTKLGQDTAPWPGKQDRADLSPKEP